MLAEALLYTGLAVTAGICASLLFGLRGRRRKPRLHGARRGAPASRGSLQDKLKDATQTLMREADEGHEPISVVFAQIDETDAPTSSHLHKCEKIIGTFLNTHVPEGSLAARYGTGKFLIMLRNYDLQMAVGFAEQLLARLERRMQSTGEIEGLDGLSFGAAARDRGEVFKSVTQRADKALYLAKSSGGNQVRTQADLNIAYLRLVADHMRKNADRGDTNAGDDPTAPREKV